MFSPLAPPPSHRPSASAATAVARPRRVHPAAPSLDEAYELRLLAEVGRWDDEAAFEELFARHRSAVVQTAFSICGDSDTAEDIAQQTFTALWVRASRLVEKSVRLGPWLMTVARNAAFDHLRAERRDEAVAGIDFSVASAASPEAAAIAGERAGDLARAMSRLSPQQRAAFDRVHVAQLTFAAAAHELGVPVGTVKTRVRAALRRLRAELERKA